MMPMEMQELSILSTKKIRKKGLMVKLVLLMVMGVYGKENKTYQLLDHNIL